MRPETLPGDAAKQTDSVKPNSWCVLMFHHELGKVLFSGIKSSEDARAFVWNHNRDTDTVSQRIIHSSAVIESDKRNARLVSLS